MTVAQKNKIIARMNSLKSTMTKKAIDKMSASELEDALVTVNKLMIWAMDDRCFLPEESRQNVHMWCVDRSIEILGAKNRGLTKTIRELRMLKLKTT